jgi:peroxiredoxin
MGSLEWVVVTVLGIAVVGACVLLYQLMVQNGRVMLRLEALERQLREQDILPPEGQPLPAGLPAGSVPGDFSLPSLAGETVTLSQCRGRRVLLIFVHPGCGFSARFLAELAPLANAPGNLAAAPLFISRGDPVENRRWFEQHGISFPVLLQEDSEVASLFQVPGTPTGYLLDENGTTVSEMLVGADSLLVELRPAGPSASIPSRLSSRAGEPPNHRKFTRSLAESRIPRNGLTAGTPAPDFILPSLHGADVSLKDYRGRRVLLVFSDPGCQPCNRVAQELERIHRRSKRLQVLMVSRGDRLANEEKAAEYGLTFPIVLQRHWEISRAYALFATPVGYLIDEDGVILSGAAVGADPILKLAV